MSYTSVSAGQIECLKLLTINHNSDQIAAALGVSVPYVEEQLEMACERLGVRTTLEAAMIASELGLI